ncbi:MAG: hypothetical protein IJ730_08005 [Alphaproteobacteria bacterium]|nr:hypothetical protein [Alphaproteobacteria bacterium]
MGEHIKIGLQDDKKVNVYRISKILSPFYIIVAHELIHLKHFLDTCLRRDEAITYGNALRIQDYNDLPDGLDLPELSEEHYFPIKALRREIPWTNYEERRTVIGPDIDNISELSFRVVAGLPIRYIYQGPGNCFCEMSSIIHKIVKQAFVEYSIENIDKLISALIPDGYLKDYDHCEDISSYLPLKIRLALFDNNTIIREAHINGQQKKEEAKNFLNKERSKASINIIN